MRYSFTATTTAQSVQANLFAEWLLPQSLHIFNSWANPVFFTNNWTATATSCIKIPSDATLSTIITQPLTSLSFITTGGNSIVVIETL